MLTRWSYDKMRLSVHASTPSTEKRPLKIFWKSLSFVHGVDLFWFCFQFNRCLPGQNDPVQYWGM